MRDRLAHRESFLVHIERALEEHQQQLGRGAGRLRAGSHHIGQPIGMVLLQLIDAGVQAAKRLPCDGSTSVSAGSARMRIQRCQESGDLRSIDLSFHGVVNL